MRGVANLDREERPRQVQKRIDTQYSIGKNTRDRRHCLISVQTKDKMPSEPSAKPVDVSVVDTNKAEWVLFPVDYINAKLEHTPLHDDEETGMMVLKMLYRAGFTNPWYVNCSDPVRRRCLRNIARL